MKLTIPNGETRASNRQSVRIKNSDAKVIRCKRRIVNKIRCKRRTTIETIFQKEMKSLALSHHRNFRVGIADTGNLSARTG